VNCTIWLRKSSYKLSDGQNGRGEIIVGVRLRGERTAAPAGDTPHTRPTLTHGTTDRTDTRNTQSHRRTSEPRYRSLHEPP